MASARITSVLCLLATRMALAQNTKPLTYYDVYTYNDGENVNLDLKNKYFSVADGYDNQLNCFTNEQVPSVPRSLSFCHKFNDNACCVPQLDDENNDFFGQLTNLGLSCRLRGDIRDDALAKMYCMNCDPDQPKYVRVGASVESMMDTSGGRYVDEGGDRKFHTADFAPAGELQIVLVSLQWAKDEFGADPLLVGRDNRLAKCGLLVSVPCAGDTVEALEGRDRYMCGDDLFLPANSGYGVIQMDDNGAYLVNESLFQFFNYPDLGTPMINDGFIFFLVDERPCDANAEDGVLDPSVYINPHCARTAEQIKTVKISELDNKMTYRDWVCANVDGQFTEYSSSDDDGAVPLNETLWLEEVNANANYCEGVCNNELEDCNNGNEDQCKAYAKLVMGSAKARCCCGHWNDEMVFSSAATMSPLLSLVAGLFLVFIVEML